MTGGAGAGRRGRLLPAGLAALALALLLAALWYTRPRPLRDWPGFPAGADAEIQAQVSWVDVDTREMGTRTTVLEAGDPRTQDFLDALGEMDCARALGTLLHRGDTWETDGGGAHRFLLFLTGGEDYLSLSMMEDGRGIASGGESGWYIRMEEEDVHWVWDYLMDMGIDAEA